MILEYWTTMQESHDTRVLDNYARVVKEIADNHTHEVSAGVAEGKRK
jgi:hypothetical protein